jgi:hypothetical protein
MSQAEELTAEGAKDSAKLRRVYSPFCLCDNLGGLCGSGFPLGTFGLLQAALKIELTDRGGILAARSHDSKSRVLSETLVSFVRADPCVCTVSGSSQLLVRHMGLPVRPIHFKCLSKNTAAA